MKKLIVLILTLILVPIAYGGPTFSGAGGGSTSPGGANGSVQCNSSGSFGACSNITDIAPIPASYLDTDSTMAANSDAKVATQKAVKTALSSLTPDAATAAGPLCKDEAGQVVNCGNLEDVAYPQTDLIEEAANLQAADFNGLKPFGWIGGNLTLPTAAANLYRPFGIGFPSGTYDLVPASYLDVISYNGTAITAGYSLACSGVGLYSIMGTGANAWHVFGPASGCTEGTTTHLADLNLSVSSLVFGGEETKSVTVTNAGTRPTTPATSLTTGTHFSITSDTCNGQSIAPEGTCQVEVTSDGEGEYEDTLNIAYYDYGEHAASESPLQVSLSEEEALSCTGATNQLEVLEAGGENPFANTSAIIWRASEIVYAGTTGTACKLVTNLNCTTTDCTQIITGYIYGNNPTGDGGTADGVGDLVGTCTGTYDSTPLTTDDTDIELTSCSGTLTNGDKYWLVIKSNAADGTNYFKWSSDASCATEKIGYSADGSTWTYTSGACGVFKLYILE